MPAPEPPGFASQGYPLLHLGPQPMGRKRGEPPKGHLRGEWRCGSPPPKRGASGSGQEQPACEGELKSRRRWAALRLGPQGPWPGALPQPSTGAQSAGRGNAPGLRWLRAGFAPGGRGCSCTPPGRARAGGRAALKLSTYLPLSEGRKPRAWTSSLAPGATGGRRSLAYLWGRACRGWAAHAWEEAAPGLTCGSPRRRAGRAAASAWRPSSTENLSLNL